MLLAYENGLIPNPKGDNDNALVSRIEVGLLKESVPERHLLVKSLNFGEANRELGIVLALVDGWEEEV